MLSRLLSILLVLGFLASGYLYWQRAKVAPYFFMPPHSNVAVGVSSADRSKADVEIVATELAIPWEVAFLPDRTLLVTERSGRLLRILPERAATEVAGVAHVGEGGLLGMAIHPDFAQNGWIYLYLTTRSEGGLTNRVERYRLAGTELSDRRVLVADIPGAANHDGGRLAFGPDGLLYIATGDAGQEKLAQDMQSLAGKILRVDDDGGIPSENPFGTAIYSWGHRNVQGLAWDNDGRLWATEHGRSGIKSGFDELNLITKGSNYGWPTVEGDARETRFVSPILNSGADDTWAPSGAAYWNGSIFFGGLRGEALYEATLTDTGATLRQHFRGEFGRIRAVARGPEGYLYLTTSNTDGRGQERAHDDKIIRINPQSLR